MVRIRQEAPPLSVAGNKNGWLPEWPNGADCKSAVFRLRWFESISTHSQGMFRGNSSVDRALAFQAGGRGFEPRGEEEEKEEKEGGKELYLPREPKMA